MFGPAYFASNVLISSDLLVFMVGPLGGGRLWDVEGHQQWVGRVLSTQGTSLTP